MANIRYDSYCAADMRSALLRGEHLDGFDSAARLLSEQSGKLHELENDLKWNIDKLKGHIAHLRSEAETERSRAEDAKKTAQTAAKGLNSEDEDEKESAQNAVIEAIEESQEHEHRAEELDAQADEAEALLRKLEEVYPRIVSCGREVEELLGSVHSAHDVCSRDAQALASEIGRLMGYMEGYLAVRF